MTAVLSEATRVIKSMTAVPSETTRVIKSTTAVRPEITRVIKSMTAVLSETKNEAHPVGSLANCASPNAGLHRPQPDPSHGHPRHLVKSVST